MAVSISLASTPSLTSTIPSSTLQTATSTSSLATQPSSSLICQPGSSIPTSLPNVNTSVSWCGVAFTDLLTTSEMAACCYNGTVFSNGPCQWCTLLTTADRQSTLSGTFGSCLNGQLASNNKTQPYAEYCNLAQTGGAVQLRGIGQSLVMAALLCLIASMTLI